MPHILVSSRSFGEFVASGRQTLIDNGFSLARVAEEDRPLDEAKMIRVVSAQRPDAIISGTEPVTHAVLAASPALRLVMKHGVGVDNIDLAAAAALGVAVANAPGGNTDTVAELTIGLMLALLRGICRAADGARRGVWKRVVGHELGVMTVGVIGTGRIGVEVIRRLHPFGCRILAHDLIVNDAVATQYGVCYTTLSRLLQESDLVTLHVPLTEDTRGLIGRPELELMKETALLVNVARAELADEEALFAHLRAGRLAGAALDVFTPKLPQGDLLIGLENVLATPHIGGYTYEAMERVDRACAETILAVFSGKPIPNLLTPMCNRR
jgi:D-3-phosphoglycerate dehydrogenase